MGWVNGEWASRRKGRANGNAPRHPARCRLRLGGGLAELADKFCAAGFECVAVLAHPLEPARGLDLLDGSPTRIGCVITEPSPRGRHRSGNQHHPVVAHDSCELPQRSVWIDGELHAVDHRHGGQRARPQPDGCQLADHMMHTVRAAHRGPAQRDLGRIDSDRRGASPVRDPTPDRPMTTTDIGEHITRRQTKSTGQLVKRPRRIHRDRSHTCRQLAVDRRPRELARRHPRWYAGRRGHPTRPDERNQVEDLAESPAAPPPHQDSHNRHPPDPSLLTANRNTRPQRSQPPTATAPGTAPIPDPDPRALGGRATDDRRWARRARDVR